MTFILTFSYDFHTGVDTALQSVVEAQMLVVLNPTTSLFGNHLLLIKQGKIQEDFSALPLKLFRIKEKCLSLSFAVCRLQSVIA